MRGNRAKTYLSGRRSQKRLPFEGKERIMGYGRKLKGTSRRVPITVHAPLDRLDAIDEYVEERRQQEGKAYSRSDFLRGGSRLVS